MIKLYRHIVFVIAVAIGCWQGKAIAGTEVHALKCEMLSEPLGIDNVAPRLSWQIIAEGRGIRQTAYQLTVSSSAEKLKAGEGDLWDSGKITSAQSIMVSYKGRPLASRATCFWKVKVWTNNGASATSDAARFSIGLLKPADWAAKWIGYERGFPWDSVSKFSRLSARYYRKQFNTSKEVKRATAYIVGLGLYQLYLNGQQIGDAVLAQSPTDYNKSVKYTTYDVTDKLNEGDNAVGVVLGNGRYFTMRPKYKPKKIKEFGFPKLLFQLEIEYNNGKKETIISDENWKFTADGPIRSNNEYDGEEYDATKEFAGWDKAGFNDAAWLKPELVETPAGVLNAQMNEPVKVMNKLKPLGISQNKPGVWILDMGQNMAGWLQIKVKGKRGDKVTLRYAETLQPDGSLYTANLRDAKVTDNYTLKGTGEEAWHPAFVYHGFRYAEITGFPGTPSTDDFEGQVVYDDMATIGSFQTSDPLVNQIYKNAYWGILSNYKGMPVDCPQRNERMPWLGDRAVGSLGESFMFANGNLYAKWLDDIQQSQTAEGAIPDVAPAYWNYYSDNMTWPGTYILIADMLYKQFADKAPIEKHYPSMKKWMGYMRGRYMKNYLLTKDKYGDWCVPPESPEMIHAKDPARITDGKLIATAYYFHLAKLMQKFATMLGKPADAEYFSDLSANVRQAFNTAFLDKKTFKYANNTVTANLLPLYFGITPQAYRKQVFNNIIQKIINDDKGHISTGVIGTQWLMRGLSAYGRPDVAYRIAANDTYPGWGYMAKHGATTIWELWNGDTANPAMNSHNHIMLLGDLITWMYEDLAGIRSATAGFKIMEMRPHISAGASFAKATYQSPYGQIKSDWTNDKQQFSWAISIPVNSTAVVYLPAKSIKNITESGQNIAQVKGVKLLRQEGGQMVFEVGSGEYQFKVKQQL